MLNAILSSYCNYRFFYNFQQVMQVTNADTQRRHDYYYITQWPHEHTFFPCFVSDLPPYTVLPRVRILSRLLTHKFDCCHEPLMSDVADMWQSRHVGQFVFNYSTFRL